MTFLEACTLAILQGITEFLPVSSSAHLVLVPYLLGWPDQGVVFDIAVHLGTLLAVMLYFYRDVGLLLQGHWHLLRGDVHHPATQLLLQLGVATIPVVSLGLLLADWVSAGGRLVPILATTSIVFGLLLWWADRQPTRTSAQNFTYWHALLFGVGQACALIPGTSRSGACVTVGRLLGYDRHFAGRFGTLMALPTIGLAGLYSLTKIPAVGLHWGQDAPVLLTGVLVSFLTAIVGIHLLMTLLVRIGYWPFVWYRVALGVGLLSVWLYL